MKKFWCCLILVLAFVLGFHSTIDAAQAATSNYTYKITTNTVVYKQPTTHAATLQVPKGTRVALIQVKGKWAKVRRAGHIAYIPIKFLARIRSAPAPWKKLIGRLCSKNPTPPKTFDSGSFVQWCARKYANIKLPRTSQQQAAAVSYKRVNKLTNLQPYDILFFDTDDDTICDHSAIYLGNKKFIEASAAAGKVQVNHFTSWYISHFLFARRLGG